MTLLARHLASSGQALLIWAALLSAPLAEAQTAPPATPETNISDRVKKDAASPLYWIRLNAQKNDSTAAPKAAPRIAEIRPVAPPRPAPAAAPANTAAATSTGGSSTSSGPAHASGALASANEATATLAAPGQLAPPNAAAASLAGTVGAGMVAPSGTSAADAARAAAAAEPEEPLALVKADEPEFPVIMMRRLRKGSVQVRFDVQPDGSVANASVVQTSARSLNDAALEAVKAWQFRPVSSPRSAIVDLGFDLDG
jgi:TonB family protein